RAALEHGELAAALGFLREARREAVAQGRLSDLLAVHELVGRLLQRSDMRIRAESERLARKTASDLRAAAQAAGLASGRARLGSSFHAVRGPSDSQARSPVLATTVAAAAWVGLGLLGVAVKLFLVSKHRGAGVAALIWGVLLGAYLWWGSHQVGLREWKAELLGILSGLAIAFFVYLRGASLDRPPADR